MNINSHVIGMNNYKWLIHINTYKVSFIITLQKTLTSLIIDCIGEDVEILVPHILLKKKLRQIL